MVADPNQADAVLTGALAQFRRLSHHLRPERPRHGGAGGRHLQVTLTDRATGTVLFTRPGIEFRERYEITIDPKAYFDESGTAMDRLSATWRAPW